MNESLLGRKCGVKMILKYLLIFIPAVFNCVLGQHCKLSSGEGSFCRKPDECYGPSQRSNCKNGYVCCQISGKSERKCREYGAFVFKPTFSAALTARSMRFNASDCNIEATPLVVGGSRAKPKEFPHMVGIGYGKDINKAAWLCGGSLISENYVLTAAHCSTSERQGRPRFARLGTVNVKNPVGSNHQDFTILSIISHPKYEKKTADYDIALYKLSGSVKINAFVRPACLHTTFDEIKLKKGTATGWGKVSYSATGGSEDLMKVALDFIDTSKCTSLYYPEYKGKPGDRKILPSQICAGELKGGKDTCQGDSGGPLQTVSQNPYCMYKIVGITSFGKFCGFKNSPAVYTRVSYFVPWIESIVWS